jgi:group I intron endonuclease
MYVGSASDLYARLHDHVTGHSSNVHLQFAIQKYGLSAFTFSVVEFCSHSELLSREQHWLDWLFSLPSRLKYNFNPIAACPPDWTGKSHTVDRKQK